MLTSHAHGVLFDLDSFKKKIFDLENSEGESSLLLRKSMCAFTLGFMRKEVPRKSSSFQLIRWYF